MESESHNVTAAMLVWLKVGSEIFDPDHVQSARSTVNDIKGQSPHTP